MMRKTWMAAALLGVCVSQTAVGIVEGELGGVPVDVAAQGLNAWGGDTGVKVSEAIKTFRKIGGGFPVLDITSVPAHAIVATEQEFIRMTTEEETQLKEQIKEKMSLKRVKASAAGLLPGEVGGIPTEAKGATVPVDAKLSRIKIQSQSANAAVEEGIVKEGVTISGGKKEITEEGKLETYDLAGIQQANWTSTVGDLEGKQAYEDRRRYIEQEQAIRMLALAVVLRSEVESKLMGNNGPMEKAKANYEASDTKKDLDGKSGQVENTNDFNQALRQYAYYSLVYDQMLSLEQQIAGLRLQAKAGMYAQNAAPISDMLEKDRPTPKGGFRDEVTVDVENNTGTRKNSGSATGE